MKITLVAVSSIDGKLTRGRESDISKWASAEDAKHFDGLKAKHNLIVMGRGTYDAMQSTFQSGPNKLRVILTRHPHDFDNVRVPGSLEFSNESPSELTWRLQRQGYKEMLLAGGGQINAEFLTANLVDEIYLTIEPRVFGGGTDIAQGGTLNVELELISQKQLNPNGTILLHYRVLH